MQFSRFIFFPTFLVVWTCALLCDSTLRAQETESVLLQESAATNGHPVPGFSLNEATNLAIEHSPEVRQYSWLVEKAIADGFQQSRLVNPKVGTLANEIGNDGSAGQYGFFLQRNLVRNNRVEQIQNAFQWKARGLEQNSRVVQRKIARSTAKIFIDVEWTRQKVELAKRKKMELERIRNIAVNLSKGGEISELEVAKIDLELATLSQNLDLLELDIPSYLQLLQTYTGSVIDFELDFDFEQEVQAVLTSSFERVVDLNQHPAVESVTQQIEAQRWQVQVAKSGQTPDWVMQTSVNYDFATDDYFGGFMFNVPWQINDKKQGSNLVKLCSGSVFAGRTKKNYELAAEKIDPTQSQEKIVGQSNRYDIQVNSTQSR